MDCRQADNLLIDFLYGELSPADRDAFERHLQECPAHAKEVGKLLSVLKLVREGLREEPPEAVSQRILAEARRAMPKMPKPIPWWHWVWSPAAAAAVLVIVVVAVGVTVFTSRQESSLPKAAPGSLEAQPLPPPPPQPTPVQQTQPAARLELKSEEQKQEEQAAHIGTEELSPDNRTDSKSATLHKMARDEEKRLVPKEVNALPEYKTKAAKMPHAKGLLAEPSGPEANKPAPAMAATEAKSGPAGSKSAESVGAAAPGKPAGGAFAEVPADQDAQRKPGRAKDRDKKQGTLDFESEGGRGDTAKDDIAKNEAHVAAQSVGAGMAKPAEAAKAPAVAEPEEKPATTRQFAQPPPAKKTPASAKGSPARELAEKDKSPQAAPSPAPNEETQVLSGESAGVIEPDPFDLAERDLANNKVESALAGYRAFLAGHPSEARITLCRYRIATALVRLQRCAEAIVAIQKAVAGSPRHVLAADALLDQASCHERLGQLSQAATVYRQVEREYPTHQEDAHRALDRLERPAPATTSTPPDNR